MTYGEGYLCIFVILILLGLWLPHPAGWVIAGVFGGLLLFG